MKPKRLGATITILGGLILLASWLFQQTLLDRANTTLDEIDHAQSTFQTYQSNNALFNALLAAETTSKPTEKIRRFQIFNYELGLEEMEGLLSARTRRTLPPYVSAYSGVSVVKLMQTTQTRLDKIQDAVSSKRDRVIRHKNQLYWAFFALYFVGSVAILGGNILRGAGSGEPSAA